MTYEQLMEMISAFQWLPDEKRFRLALEIDRNHGPGNQIFGCLLNYAAAIERLERRGALTAAEIQVFLVKLAERYELVQWVDGESVVVEVKRLVQAVGVHIVMIGKGNAFVTAFVMVVRRLVPMEWNAFCDYVERVNWKVVLSHAGPQSRTAVSTDDTNVEPDRSSLDEGAVTDGAARLGAYSHGCGDWRLPSRTQVDPFSARRMTRAVVCRRARLGDHTFGSRLRSRVHIREGWVEVI